MLSRPDNHVKSRLPRRKSNKPATLYRVMQAMIGHELKARYEVPDKMPHQLLVLLMQMNEHWTRKRRQRRA